MNSGVYSGSLVRAGMLCVLVLILTTAPMVAAGGADDYNEANALYRAGQYAEAVARYESLLAEGLRNGAAYYNLGNAYYKMGKIGRAILWYERALRLMPGDEDTKSNLRFVDALKADRDPEEDVNVITRFLVAAFAALSPSGLAEGMK